ncbi:MAG: pyruvoyl-dependent arginine decarboxylase, partial [Planctomycetota bacterium]|nr:pyruvoyl-dependent arginine decarboxylase [Planctomycetota bacterium]
VPRDPNQYGYLSEHHAYGVTGEKAGDYAEDLAAQMLATTLGVPFDVESSWDEKKQQYKFGGRIVLTRNITQSAEGDKDGLWTTVIAAAVMVGEWS